MTGKGTDMPEITVVIPNYKGIRFIHDCLSALENQEEGTPEYEILVVDNASKDGSVELIRERHPKVRLICLEENTGFCSGVNLGIQESSSPFVLLLNNDTKVYPDFVRKLYETISEDEKCFSVSAAMLMWDRPELLDDAGDGYNLLGWAYSRGKGKPAAKYCRRARIFSACAGAAIYRRSVLEQIGLFDENHFAYLEDVDLGYRARIYGFYNLYEPQARVVHYGSASTGSRYNEWKTERVAANSVYVVAKNMPILQKLVNLPFLLPGFFVKFVFFVCKKMGRLYLKGLWQGLRKSFSSDGRKRKIPFRISRLQNYLLIEWELFLGIFRFLMKS